MGNTKEPTELTELEVDEISLVKQGANRKQFKILKEDGAPVLTNEVDMDDISYADVLKADLGTEDTLRETLKQTPELSTDATDALVGIVKLATAYAEQLPSDIFDTLAQASGFEKAVKKQPLPADGKTPAKPDDDEEDEDDEDQDQEDQEATPQKAKKGTKKMKKSDAVQKALERIEKEEDIDLFPEDIQKAVRPLWKSNVELKEEVRKMQDEALTKEFVVKAAEYTHLPKAPEFATVLKSMSQKLDADEFAVVEGVFKASEEALKESGLFAEVGSTVALAGTPEGQLAALAKEKLEKSDDKTYTSEQAMADATMAHPEIYEEMTRNRQ